MANDYRPVITAVPLTTRMTKSSLPTHVVLLTGGLSAESLALCEQIITLDRPASVITSATSAAMMAALGNALEFAEISV